MLVEHSLLHSQTKPELGGLVLAVTWGVRAPTNDP